MYFSKLVGIREKSWEIDGKKGENKTFYFLKKEDPTENNELSGYGSHAYSVSKDSKFYNYDLKINEEYFVALNDKGKIEDILTADFKPIKSTGVPVPTAH